MQKSVNFWLTAATQQTVQVEDGSRRNGISDDPITGSNDHFMG